MAPYTRSMHRSRQIRDWSDLEEGILDFILQRLPYPDCLNFGKVCSCWRSVFVHRRKTSCPPPCLLHASTVGGSTLHRGIIHGGQLRRLFSSWLELFPGNRIVGSCFGWLVIVGRFARNIYLLNPASNERIPLPCLKLYYVMHVDLSVSPTNGHCILVARVMSDSSLANYLVSCRPGDKQWTKLTFQLQDPSQKFIDSVFHKGKYYVLWKNDDIAVCTFDPQPNMVFFDSINNFCSIKHYRAKRFVQSNGELLLVLHQTWNDQLHVFKKREEQNGEWVRVDNLDNQVLLIGIHGAESVCTKDLMGSTYEPNTIYCHALNQSSLKYFYRTMDTTVRKYSLIHGRMGNINLNEEPLEWVVTQKW